MGIRHGRKYFSTAIIFVIGLIGCEILCQEKIDPKNGVEDPDGKILWYDCKLLDVEGKGWTDTESFYDRLPAKAKGVVPAPVWDLSHNSAGICVLFTSDSPVVRVRWTLSNNPHTAPHMADTGASGVDLYSKDKDGKWIFMGNGRPDSVSNSAQIGIPANAECLLYLPPYNGVKSVEIGIPKDKTISKSAHLSRQKEKPIVFYGTSITQGGCASRPGLPSTAIVGRAFDIPVINLGFSGNGKMEMELADLLAELDPSLYVLDCLWNMSDEMVVERVPPFVKKLRSVHPKTPILLVEDSNFRNMPTSKGNAIRKIYDQLKKDGVEQIFILSNENMLGDDFEGTVDGCHPNDLGMMRQSEAFIEIIGKILNKKVLTKTPGKLRIEN